MTLAYIALALVRGAACGTMMAYELRGSRGRNPWEPWLLFAACAVVIIAAANA